MDELKAREICLATGLHSYTRDECAQADQWVKNYTLEKLKRMLPYSTPPAIRSYIVTMATYTYGSAETDQFLQTMNCYPKWMQS